MRSFSKACIKVFLPISAVLGPGYAVSATPVYVSHDWQGGQSRYFAQALINRLSKNQKIKITEKNDATLQVLISSFVTSVDTAQYSDGRIVHASKDVIIYSLVTLSKKNGTNFFEFDGVLPAMCEAVSADECIADAYNQITEYVKQKGSNDLDIDDVFRMIQKERQK